MAQARFASDLTPKEQEILAHRQRLLIPLADLYGPPRSQTLDATHELRLSYQMVKLLLVGINVERHALRRAGHIAFNEKSQRVRGGS